MNWPGPKPMPTDIALEVAWAERDAEDQLELAWLQVLAEPLGRRRRRFGDAILQQYPLTQPPDICARCRRWTCDEDEAWDLDHMVELQGGGLDHPANLVRLCHLCHRAKPLPPDSMWDEPAAWRAFILRWVTAGPGPNERRQFQVDP